MTSAPSARRRLFQAFPLAAGLLASCANAAPDKAGAPADTVRAAPAKAGPSSATVVKDCPYCPELVPVGTPPATRGRRLFVARFELTWREYLPSVEQAGCPGPKNKSGEPIDLSAPSIRDNFPMTSIQPGEIGCFLTWIRAKTGKPFRLPTSAEWEWFSGMGRGRGPLPARDVPASEAFLLNRLGPAPVAARESREPVRRRMIQPVGTLRPTAAGLHDLFGNAGEVVSDPLPPLPNRSGQPGARPLRRVMVKGGSLGSLPELDVLGGHEKYIADTLSYTVGFRLVYEGTE